MPSITPYQHRMNSGSDDLQISEGTWWRLTGDLEQVTSHDWAFDFFPPEHGVILLLRDVRIVDGVFHSVIFESHPAWARKEDVRLHFETMLENFTIEPNGEALREVELALIMNDVTRIQSSMHDRPSSEYLEKIADQRKQAEQDPGNQLPDLAALPPALLPNGASEGDRLKTELAAMEATRSWISELSSQMKERLDVAGSFYRERSAAALAGIASKRKEAEKLLSGIHSLGLWLGDDVGIHKLVDGPSAPADEPLHLMQRMLYLDEEIYTDAILSEGFTANEMQDLPDLLTHNPELVQRMLPYPRCVAITRVRRKSRELPVPRDWVEIFNLIEEQKADMRIQILVRDGDRVHMIHADQDTSHAERLFPSRAEMEAIFTARNRYDFERGEYETRTITPRDIDYSEKRNEHDMRALFYRRFLLILWGAQEREQVFGPFLSGQDNWIEASADPSRFVFIHDEEDVLHDGRPDVLTWMQEANRALSSGSQVAVHVKRAGSPDSMPTNYKYEGGMHYHSQYDIGDELVSLTLQRRGVEVIARVPMIKSRYPKDIVVNVPMIVRSRNDDVLRDGILCLDDVASSDLRYYIASRINRQSYLKWLPLFRFALPLIEERERIEVTLADQIIAAGRAYPDDRDFVIRAVRLVREKARTDNPDYDKIVRLAFSLKDGVPERLRSDYPDAVEFRLTSENVWRVLMPDGWIRNAKFPVPVLSSVMVRKARRGKMWRESDGGRVAMTTSRERGECVIATRLSTDEISRTWTCSPAGLRHVPDWEMLESLSSPEHEQKTLDFIEAWQHPTEFMLEQAFDECHRVTMKAPAGSGVMIIDPMIAAGAAVMNAGQEGRYRAVMLSVQVNLVAAAMRFGHDDILRRFCFRTYRYGDKGFNLLSARGKKAKDHLSPYATILSEECRLSDIATATDDDRLRSSLLTPFKISIYNREHQTREVEIGKTLREAIIGEHLHYRYRAISESDFEKLHRDAAEASLLIPESVENWMECCIASKNHADVRPGGPA